MIVNENSAVKVVKTLTENVTMNTKNGQEYPRKLALQAQF